MLNEAARARYSSRPSRMRASFQSIHGQLYGGRRGALQRGIEATTEMVFVIWLIFISNSVCLCTLCARTLFPSYFVFSVTSLADMLSPAPPHKHNIREKLNTKRITRRMENNTNKKKKKNYIAIFALTICLHGLTTLILHPKRTAFRILFFVSYSLCVRH